MKQSITAPSYAVNNVSNLPDIVKNQATTVKTTFDKASADIKAYETNLIAELNGNAGSFKIGHNSTNVTSNNVGDALEEIITAINEVTLGDIPNNSITNIKLAEDVKVGSLASLTTTEKSNVVGAINEVDGLLINALTDITTLETDLNIIRTAKLATGSVNAMLIDTDGTFDLTRNGNILTIIPNLTTTNATVTIAVDGQVAKLVKKANDIGNFVAIDIGDLKKNTPAQLVWDSGSDFFIFAPKSGGSNIKSIQRGSSSITAISQDVSITGIDTTKSIVIMTQKFFGTNLDTGKVAVEIFDSTNIRFRVAVIPVGAIPVQWQVIEFNNVKSKQSGSKAMTTATTQTLTSISTAKSIVFATWTINEAQSTFTRDTMNVYLTDSTTLTFDPQTTNSKVVYYQVIEFN